MTDTLTPDLTAPEQVERLAAHIQNTCGCALGANAEQPVAATLRALSAALLSVCKREAAMYARYDAKLEAAEAERDALDAAWSERVALLEKAISKAEAERAAAVRYIRGNAILCLTSEHDEDEMWMIDLDTLRHWRDAQIVAARAFLAARQKGGE